MSLVTLYQMVFWNTPQSLRPNLLYALILTGFDFYLDLYSSTMERGTGHRTRKQY